MKRLSDLSDGSCARVSLQHGESLAGTAAGPVSDILLLEWRERWDKSELDALDPNTYEIVLRWLEGDAGRRLQLIRQPRQKQVPRFAHVDLVAGDYRWFDRAALADVTEADRSGDPSVKEERARGAHSGRRVDRIVLVCTHGTRDDCCAIMGNATFRGLREELGARDDVLVWQTSHLGGHRFAPTLVTLPDGYCYGRMTEENWAAFVAGYRRGTLGDLDMVRGRMLYDKPMQAVEIAIRKLVDDDKLHTAFTCDLDGEEFQATLGDSVYCGRVKQVSTEPRIKSCGGEPESVAHFVVEEVRRR